MTHRIPALVVLCCLVAASLLSTPAARAQKGGSPDDILSKVGFDQRMGAQVSPDLAFRDETGAPVRFGDYFGAKPVVLMLGYLGCPNLCSVVSHEMAASFNGLALTIGTDFTVVSVSIDPQETPELAAAKKAEYIRDYARPGADVGWHFLTGDDAAIHTLADTVGFRYAYDATIKQFAHPAGLIVLTPQGKVTRYFYGIEYKPNDLRLGLVEAAKGTIGTPIDQFLLRCYHYDAVTGKYSLAIMNILRGAAIATTLGIAAFVVVLLRRERRKEARA